jgi:hypothetical protein
MAEEEADTTLDRLSTLGAELEEHRTRLKTRAGQITKLAEQQTEPALKDLLGLVAEGFNEQVDTGLDFQQETLTIIATAIEELEGGAEAEPGLEPEDAAQILEQLTNYRALLESAIENLGTGSLAEKALLKGKLESCLKTITLVEELTLEDDGAPESPDATDN